MEDAPQDVRLAEFASLRQGMDHRAGQQQALVGLNLTALGTIGGLVVTQKTGEELLLIAALVSPTLGLLWLDHHTNIQREGEYIREQLWRWKPSWESYFLARHHSRWKGVVFWTAIGLLFAAVPVGALVAELPDQDASSSVLLLWPIGAALTVLYVLVFLATAVASFRRAKRRSEQLDRERDAGESG